MNVLFSSKCLVNSTKNRNCMLPKVEFAISVPLCADCVVIIIASRFLLFSTYYYIFDVLIIILNIFNQQKCSTYR